MTIKDKKNTFLIIITVKIKARKKYIPYSLIFFAEQIIVAIITTNSEKFNCS